MPKFGLLVLLGVLASTQVGCGDGGAGGTSGGGSAPDFNALQTKLTQPSGTFGAGQEGALQDGFAKQSEAAQSNPFGGGSSSGSSSTRSFGELSIRTIHPLDTAGSCEGLEGGGKGSCACPNGGTLAYDIPANMNGKPGEDPSGSIDETVSIVASACGMDADQTLDGSVYWKIKNPPPMQLFSIHLKLTGKQTASYDVDYLNKDGVVTFAVDVADGTVLVSAKGNWDKNTKTGTLVITDKNETWTCEMTNGKGSCTSDKGVTRQVGG